MFATDDPVAQRAWERAQRRFRRMIVDRTMADPDARATKLYVEAERLLDRLTGEEEAFTLRVVQLDDEPSFLTLPCCGANPGGPHWVYCSERSVS